MALPCANPDCPRTAHEPEACDPAAVDTVSLCVSFGEYRAARRSEALSTVYERWHSEVGHHDAIAGYVARFGIRCRCR